MLILYEFFNSKYAIEIFIQKTRHSPFERFNLSEKLSKIFKNELFIESDHDGHVMSHPNDQIDLSGNDVTKSILVLTQHGSRSDILAELFTRQQQVFTVVEPFEKYEYRSRVIQSAFTLK